MFGAGEQGVEPARQPGQGQRLQAELARQLAPAAAQLLGGQLLGEGERLGPGVEGRIELRAESREQAHGPADEEQLHLHLEGRLVEQVAVLDEQAARLGQRHVAQVADPHPPEAIEQRRVHRLEPAQVGAWKQHAGRHVGMHDARGVARAEADEVLAQRGAQPLRHLRHHAEVDEDELVGARLAARRCRHRVARGERRLAGERQRPDEQIAGMGVGVDEVLHEDLPHVDLVEVARHLGAVDAGLLERGEAGDLQVADVLEGQGAPGALLPEDPRHVDAAVAGEFAGEAFGAPAFGLEVELAPGDGAELQVQAVEVDAPAQAAPELEQADRERGRGEVGLDQHFDARAQHLDHHPLAVRQPRPMHLRQRGRSHRHLLEPREDRGQRAPEVLLDLPHDGSERVRRHLVLEARELADDGGGKQVDAGAQELAELDQPAPHLDRQGAIAAGDPPVALGGGAAEA